MIIGLTGENCSGKGTLADYLQKKSFYFYSLSDVIRDELASKGIDITRDTLIKEGNDLRQKSGAAVLAVRTAAKLQADKNYVIDSIRNPYEVEELKKLNRFVLLKVLASPENRFERMKDRKREGDPETLEELDEQWKEAEAFAGDPLADAAADSNICNAFPNTMEALNKIA
ncbi:MAG: AAA family ATPase, partial [Nitrospinota bacterium]|nr:AAA family ATPase [Nitrospinota bacterium]